MIKEKSISHLEAALRYLARGWPVIPPAECYLLRRIGAPVTEPAMIDIRLTARDARNVSDFTGWSEEIARDHIGRIPDMVADFIEGRIAVV